MKKIASFTINHLTLLRGIYVSRRDTLPSGDVVTTIDVRMTEPNRQPALSPVALHAMEHLAATFLRNDPTWGDKIIYWGPMGCCTGNYLVLNGDYESTDVVDLVRRTMQFVAGWEGEVPGATARDCGNYTFMDLDAARREARRYIAEVLDRLTPANLNYPE